MPLARRLASVSRIAAAFGAALVLSGCFVFPAPTPPQALTKSEIGVLAKCQKAILKAQASFLKTKLGTLQTCVNGLLAVRLPFESGLTTSDEFDAGIAKMRDKCTKGYGKITAASTKLVDAIVKACTPAEPSLLGAYDGLRFVTALDAFSDPPANLEALAGTICTATSETADFNLWQGAPRVIELLRYMGPEFVLFVSMESALPNTPLDPRCPAPTMPGVM